MDSCRAVLARIVAILALTSLLAPAGSEASSLEPLVLSAAVQEATRYEGPVLLDNSQLVYTARDRLTFHTTAFLAEEAPRLLPLRAAIDTWAARLGVHPRAVVEVLQRYPGEYLQPADEIALDTVIEVARILAQVYAEQGRREPLAATRALVAASWAAGLALPEAGSPLARPRNVPQRSTDEPRIFGYFQPPWEIGETWAGGGAHGSTGSGVRNSLDFWGSFRVWGEDVSQWWVAATQAGTVRVWSSCGLSIIHANGWITDYYHLDNIVVQDGQSVQRNQRLANYAGTEAQATCQGGSATGPHVHTSYFFDDQPVAVDGSHLDFTAFFHHPGEGQYDTDCDRSWYDHDSNGRVCPNFDQLLNDAPPVTPLIFADGFESGDLSAWNPFHVRALAQPVSRRSREEDRRAQ